MNNELEQTNQLLERVEYELYQLKLALQVKERQLEGIRRYYESLGGRI